MTFKAFMRYALVLFLCTTTLALAPAPANADASHGVGYEIPYADGRPGSWIGSYNVGGVQAYCADPLRDSPSTAGGYGARKMIGSWTNLNGDKVAVKELQRAAWIVSTYGKTGDKVQAAAVSNAVYALLSKREYAFGAARNEERMRATGDYDAIKAKQKQFLDESAKYAGNVKLTIAAPKTALEKQSEVKVTVKTQYGVPLPGVAVQVQHQGAPGVTRNVTTDSNGVATASFTAQKAGKVQVTAKASGLATSLLPVRFPNNKAAQRVLVAGVTKTVSAAVSVLVEKSPVVVDTVTSQQTMTPGGEVFDTVTLTAPQGFEATVTSVLYGPFANRPGENACTSQKQYATRRNEVKGSGTFQTQPVGPLKAPGFYTWVQTIPQTAVSSFVKTRCGIAAETTQVTKYIPQYVTQVNKQEVFIGQSLFDIVKVSSVAPTTPLTFNWNLYGPFPQAPTADSCTQDKLVATGKMTVDQNGEVKTPKVEVTSLGYYTYTENNTATAWYGASETVCGEATETALVTKWTPVISTVSSEQLAAPGVQLYDTVKIKNLPQGTKTTVTAYLYGPLPSEEDIVCTSKTPRKEVTFTVTGSGTYKTPTVKIHRPGWYGWEEVIPATPVSNRVVSECRVPSETTLVVRPEAPLKVIATGKSNQDQGPSPWLPALGSLLLASYVVVRKKK